MVRIHQALDCDVLVVGAGPAGAATAYYLAKAGVRVWLADHQRFPRDKVCGDFVGPVALVELQRIGVARRKDYKRTNIIDRASLYLDGRLLIAQDIPLIAGLPAHGRVIPRKRLDEWLVDAARSAGAVLLEGHRLTGYGIDAQSATANTECAGRTRQIRARLIIGADGSNSLVARLLRGYPPPDSDRIVAVRAYYAGVTAPSNQADLYFTADSFPGYYWLFPSAPDTANVGIGMISKTLPAGKPGLKKLILQLIETDAALKQRLHNAQAATKIIGWPLTTYNHRLPIAGDRAMLVGDAAGLINPLNGEGIQYALLSGRWAAELATSRLAADNLTRQALAPYAAQVEKELRYDMALSGLIVQLIRNRILNPVWLRALEIIAARARQHHVYASVAGGVLAGLVPARRVLSQQVILGTIQEAALELGLRPALNSIFRPGEALHAGFGAVRSGLTMAVGSLRNPVDSLAWGWDLAGSATELAMQFYKND